MKKITIGIGHLIRALEVQGFGRDEVVTMRDAVITGDFSKIEFAADVYTKNWDADAQEWTGKQGRV